MSIEKSEGLSENGGGTVEPLSKGSQASRDRRDRGRLVLQGGLCGDFNVADRSRCRRIEADALQLLSIQGRIAACRGAGRRRNESCGIRSRGASGELPRVARRV